MAPALMVCWIEGGAGFFLFSVLPGGAVELPGRSRPAAGVSTFGGVVSAVCALWNFGLAGWCLYPLARGCRAPRRKQPELAATAPAIPVWRYRLVAGAAELGGSVADRGACNNVVRGIRRVCSLEFRAGGMVSLSVGAWLPSAAPDEARASGHGAGDSCLALSAGGRRGGARR